MNNQELQQLDELRKFLRRLEMRSAITNELLSAICEKVDAAYNIASVKLGRKGIPYSMTIPVPDAGYWYGNGDAFATTEV